MIERIKMNDPNTHSECETIALLWWGLPALIFLLNIGCVGDDLEKKRPPNVLFIMMDDLGYGQFGVHNDTLHPEHFDPAFYKFVQTQDGYDPDSAIAFSKKAIPTLSHLALNGVQFGRAFASSNLCAPSRIGIATGVLQNRFGIYRNTDCEAIGLAQASHLVHQLKMLQYATAHIGKWHIGRRKDQMLIDALKRNDIHDTLSYFQIGDKHPSIFEELKEAGYYGSVVDQDHPLQHGFDYYYGYNNWASQFYNSTLVWENYKHAGKQPGYNTDLFTDKALSFMAEQIQEDKPFYVQLHYHAVHDSLEPKAPAQYFNLFNSDSYFLNNFYAHISAVDFNVQRIIQYLQSVHQYENTLIIFTSDNGGQIGGPSVLPGNAPFKGQKGSFFQGGFRVPMFFHWPAGIKDKRLHHQVVSTLDILPTVIEVAGGSIPRGLDGKSLLGLLRGGNENVHEHLCWAGLHSRAWGFMVHSSFKTHVTEREFAPPAYVVVQDSFMLRYVGNISPDVYHDYPRGAPATFELFNMIKDPREEINVATLRPEKVAELSAIYTKEARHFPPPIKWSREKWSEIQVELIKR